MDRAGARVQMEARTKIRALSSNTIALPFFHYRGTLRKGRGSSYLSEISCHRSLVILPVPSGLYYRTFIRLKCNVHAVVLKKKNK